MERIAEGHEYRFVGKVGSFCPIKPGHNGGLLLREKDGKYSAATGSKGYRWLESEAVKELGKENAIDRSYYDKLVDDAVDTIAKYGDFEWFVSDDSAIDIPPWVMPCGDATRTTCVGCKNFNHDQFHLDCSLGHDIPELVLNEIVKEK